MTETDLASKAQTYLRQLCVDIPNRRVGTPGNRTATALFTDAISALGFRTECPSFDCLDWASEGASLRVNGLDYDVRVSPYSLGCRGAAPLVVASTLQELSAVGGRRQGPAGARRPDQGVADAQELLLLQSGGAPTHRRFAGGEGAAGGDRRHGLEPRPGRRRLPLPAHPGRRLPGAGGAPHRGGGGAPGEGEWGDGRIGDPLAAPPGKRVQRRRAAGTGDRAPGGGLRAHRHGGRHARRAGQRRGGGDAACCWRSFCESTTAGWDWRSWPSTARITTAPPARSSTWRGTATAFPTPCWP